MLKMPLNPNQTINLYFTLTLPAQCTEQANETAVNDLNNTVKPEIFVCPLLHEFRDLNKFAKNNWL